MFVHLLIFCTCLSYNTQVVSMHLLLIRCTLTMVIHLVKIMYCGLVFRINFRIPVMFDTILLELICVRDSVCSSSCSCSTLRFSFPFSYLNVKNRKQLCSFFDRIRRFLSLDATAVVSSANKKTRQQPWSSIRNRSSPSAPNGCMHTCTKISSCMCTTALLGDSQCRLYIESKIIYYLEQCGFRV